MNIYAKEGMIVNASNGATLATCKDDNDAQMIVTHIHALEQVVISLAKHLEAIQHITERDDMSDRKTAKAIRQHAEAFNVLEAIDFMTPREWTAEEILRREG